MQQLHIAVAEADGFVRINAQTEMVRRKVNHPEKGKS